MSNKLELATLGGGCFWCVEAVFEDLEGIIKSVSGYAAGSTPNPTYEAVCSGRTGHAEVVQLTFDPSKITYEQILNIFFYTHDPTTLNRQGNDRGTQYRSIILTHSDEQKQTAKKVIQQLTDEKVFPDPIVTTVEESAEFYEAEKYHQGYYKRNTSAGYCQFIISPKVSKLRKQYFDMLKPSAK